MSPCLCGGILLQVLNTNTFHLPAGAYRRFGIGPHLKYNFNCWNEGIPLWGLIIYRLPFKEASHDGAPQKRPEDG